MQYAEDEVKNMEEFYNKISIGLLTQFLRS